MSRRTLCRATLPKHTCTANRTGPSILPRQDRNSVLHTDLICFRSSMAWRSRSNCDHSSFVPTGTFPPQFPPSPLLNWLAKRHRFTAFVSLSLYRNIFGEAMEGRNERNEEHMITSSVPSPPSPRPPAPLTLLFHSDLLPFLRFARNYFRVFSLSWGPDSRFALSPSAVAAFPAGALSHTDRPTGPVICYAGPFSALP